jgi:hypothetical protein
MVGGSVGWDVKASVEPSREEGFLGRGSKS